MDVKPSFGARLKAAREARGIALRDVAATTKISVAALDALERDDPSRLPGGIFSRSFVRAYASEVGLDPEATVREFAERFPDTVQPLRNVADLVPAPEPGSGTSWWRGLVAALVLVVAVGAGVVMMGWTDGWHITPTAPADLPSVAGAPPLVVADPDLGAPAPPAVPRLPPRTTPRWRRRPTSPTCRASSRWAPTNPCAWRSTPWAAVGCVWSWTAAWCWHVNWRRENAPSTTRQGRSC